MRISPNVPGAIPTTPRPANTRAATIGGDGVPTHDHAYTTKAGGDLHKIFEKQYGRPPINAQEFNDWAKQVQQLNPGISNVSKVQPGTPLLLPNGPPESQHKYAHGKDYWNGKDAFDPGYRARRDQDAILRADPTWNMGPGWSEG